MGKKGAKYWGRFLEPRLLLLIKGEPSHGYELVEKVNRLPSPSPRDCEASEIYVVLRDMEKDGLVGSSWETERGLVLLRGFII